MKIVLIIGCLLFSTISNAQNYWIGQGAIGLNRIGVLYDFGAGYNFGSNRIEVGLRFYQPDLVFENEIPGLSLSYDRILLANKVNAFSGGIAIDSFTEKKGDNRLWLYNPRIFIRGERYLGNRLWLNLKLNSGFVINQLTGESSPEKKIFTYLNYEASLGIIYCIGTSIDR